MSYVRTESEFQTRMVFKPKALQPRLDTGSEYLKEYRVEEVQNAHDDKVSAKPTKFRAEIVWFNAMGFLVLHLAALYTVFSLLWRAKILTIVWTLFVAYSGGLAVTLGAHRLYTHRAFKANLWVRLIAVLAHTVAGQNCLWVWIRDHRQHHKFTETDADPHNANRGFFFAHIGWLMMRKHPDVIAKGKSIDMSDIEQDAIVMFQKRYYKTLFVIFALVIPVLIPRVLWNESLWNAFFIVFVFRLVILLNVTWLVNSAAHMYGTRPFTKNIGAVECMIVSFLAIGEGWHNYHHTFPWDYRAAEYGQYFNYTTTVIDYLAKKGWIYDLKEASPDLVKKHTIKHGDGSHPVYGQFSPDDWITNCEQAY